MVYTVTGRFPTPRLISHSIQVLAQHREEMIISKEGLASSHPNNVKKKKYENNARLNHIGAYR